MRSLFTSCPACRSDLAETLFGAFSRSQRHEVEKILLCRRCGCVYRSPVVTDDPIKTQQYGSLSAWSDRSVFQVHLARVAEEISKRIGKAGKGLHLEVGSGPGWLVQEIQQRFHQLRTLCLEPSPEVARYADRTAGRRVIVVPAGIETELPENAFSLITVCGVDYLFPDSRASLEKLARCLAPEGLLYIERNVFLDQEAFATEVIFDLDDLFGANPMMTTWFLPEHFEAYLRTMFTVTDRVEYVINRNAQFGATCRAFGWFCRRSQPKSLQGSWYELTLQVLKSRARQTSLAHLRALAAQGVRAVSLCGNPAETAALAALIRDDASLSIESVFQPTDPPPTNSQGPILIASLAVEPGRSWLTRHGLLARSLPCFRETAAPFSTITSEGNEIQIKAALPGVLSYV